MSDPVRIFAYGSNLDSRRMRGRTPSARVVGVATLERHDLRFHKRGLSCGTGKADAFPTGEEVHRVHGVIYEIAGGELPDLDRAESLGISYDRVERTVRLETENGPVEVTAWVYVAREEQIEPGLRPLRWYLDHVLRGAREHGLPDDLRRRLRRIQPV